MTNFLIPTAEPFYFPGGPTGCLLVHGFTGSPKEMLWMGEYLSQRGYSVLGVRLAGHATRPEDMLRTRWQDWSASVEDGWHMLSKSCQQTFLAGLSMGGALCLLAATQLPAAGVVAMSTPYDLPEDPRRRYIKLMYRLQPSLAKGPPDWHNPQAALDHVDYPSYPTRSILELGALLAEMRINLPKVKMPVLLIHSRQDHSVLPENMQAIYNDLGADQKSMLYVDDSNHVITREPERLRVFQAAENFFQRIVNNAV
jgi:carboxylesterase